MFTEPTARYSRVILYMAGHCSHIEDVYLAYRLRDCNLTSLATVVRLPLFNHLAKWLYKKLGGLAIVGKKAT
jgi:hypothetical protein